MPASPLQKLVKLYALSNMLNNPNHSLARARILTDLVLYQYSTPHPSRPSFLQSIPLPYCTKPYECKCSITYTKSSLADKDLWMPSRLFHSKEKQSTKKKHPPKMIYVLHIIIIRLPPCNADNKQQSPECCRLVAGKCPALWNY